MSHIDEGNLHAYLDGELSERRRAELERHLASCEDCRARLDEAKALSHGASDLLAELEPGHLAAPAWHELEARAAARGRATTRRTWLRPGVAWAASIALAFAVGWASSAYFSAGPFSARSERVASRPAVLDEAESRQSPSETAAYFLQEPTAAKTVPAPEGAEAPQQTAETRAKLEPEIEISPPAGRIQVAEEVPAEAERDDRPAAEERRERVADRLAEAPPPADTVAAVAGAETAARQAKEAPELAPAGERPAPEEPAAPAAEAQRFLARDAAGRGATQLESFFAVQPSEAEVWIGAPLRTLPDLQLKGVEVGPGATIEGAASRVPVVRLIYEDAAGHQIVLIQQWLAELGGLEANRDPTLVLKPSGLNSYRWRDPAGYLLILEGEVSSDSLRALADRVR